MDPITIWALATLGMVVAELLIIRELWRRRKVHRGPKRGVHRTMRQSGWRRFSKECWFRPSKE